VVFCVCYVVVLCTICSFYRQKNCAPLLPLKSFTAFFLCVVLFYSSHPHDPGLQSVERINYYTATTCTCPFIDYLPTYLLPSVPTTDLADVNLHFFQRPDKKIEWVSFATPKIKHHQPPLIQQQHLTIHPCPSSRASQSQNKANK